VTAKHLVNDWPRVGKSWPSVRTRCPRWLDVSGGLQSSGERRDETSARGGRLV